MTYDADLIYIFFISMYMIAYTYSFLFGNRGSLSVWKFQDGNLTKFWAAYKKVLYKHQHFYFSYILQWAYIVDKQYKFLFSKNDLFVEW